MSKPKYESYEPCIRVKLIGVLPNDRYFCSLSRYGDYYSLIGGSLDDNVYEPDENLILSNIEREFYEETFGALFISFNNRVITSALNDNKFTIRFKLGGITRDLDTFFVVIFFEENQEIDKMITETKTGRHKILCEIYGRDIDDEIAMNIIDDILQYRRYTINLVHYSKAEINRLKRETLKKYHYLEKRNISILEGCNFFDSTLMWEWKKHNSDVMREKIYNLSPLT